MTSRRPLRRLNPLPALRRALLLSAAATGLMAGTDPAHADCDPSAARSTPTEAFRFEAQGAVVRDAKTRLMWERCPEGMTYAPGAATDRSQDACQGQATAFDPTSVAQLTSAANAGAGRDGYTDWRLPTLDELSSIVENACEAPAINAIVFPDTPVQWFWASPASPQPAVAPGHVWGVGFGAGGYYVGDNRYGAVRLVRSAPD